MLTDKSLPFILRVALALTMIVIGARASEARYACAIIATPDGFVALRKEPSARSQEIAKMKPQEMVGLLHPDTEDIVRSGDWLYVRWYPGTRRTEDHIPDIDDTKAISGWVKDSLITCFE